MSYIFYGYKLNYIYAVFIKARTFWN